MVMLIKNKDCNLIYTWGSWLNLLIKERKNMFKLELDIPTYAEWKVQIEKFLKEQPEQAKKYQE